MKNYVVFQPHVCCCSPAQSLLRLVTTHNVPKHCGYKDLAAGLAVELAPAIFPYIFFARSRVLLILVSEAPVSVF